MIRIKTKWDDCKVLTIWFNEKWYTLAHKGETLVYDYEAKSLLEAGQNHLLAASDLKRK